MVGSKMKKIILFPVIFILFSLILPSSVLGDCVINCMSKCDWCTISHCDDGPCICSTWCGEHACDGVLIVGSSCYNDGGGHGSFAEGTSGNVYDSCGNTGCDANHRTANYDPDGDKWVKCNGPKEEGYYASGGAGGNLCVNMNINKCGDSPSYPSGDGKCEGACGAYTDQGTISGWSYYSTCDELSPGDLIIAEYSTGSTKYIDYDCRAGNPSKKDTCDSGCWAQDGSVCWGGPPGVNSPLCLGDHECNDKITGDPCGSGGTCDDNCQCWVEPTTTTTTILPSVCSGTNSESCSYNAGTGKCEPDACCYETGPYGTECAQEACFLLGCDASNQPCQSCNGCSCGVEPSTCFPAGTKITMADGVKKNIEDVREGDVVLSYDTEIDAYVPRKVLFFDDKHAVGSHAKACEELGDNPSLYTINGLIEFTPEHPFYVRENGETKWAALVPDMVQHPKKGIPEDFKLKPGQEILVKGEWIEIKEIGVSRENIPEVSVYNLVIEDTHTYIANDIVVHNKCFPPGTKVTMSDESKKNIEEVKIGESVLTFNEQSGEKETGIVTNIERPIDDHLYSINKGIIETTRDHPFYSRKPDGTIVWAAIDKEATIEKMPYLYFVEELELGDEIMDEWGKWIRIESMEYKQGRFQVYNLLGITENPNFFANALLVHNRNGGTTTTTTTSTTTTVPPEICDNSVDDDGDGDTDCQDSDCWGTGTGASGNTCCNDPSYCGSDAGCVDECVNNECQNVIRPLCDQTECGILYCNGVDPNCLEPDNDEIVCVDCLSQNWDTYASSPPACCGDDGAGSLDDNWCTPYPVGDTGGSCIDGSWDPDHCNDWIQNGPALGCDEEGVDCGGLDCEECCVGCQCIDITIGEDVSTKTGVENSVEISLFNKDPSHLDMAIEVYINNSEDLDNCFGNAWSPCDPWDYHFENSAGHVIGYSTTSPILVPNLAIERIYFHFTPSGPTPVDKYKIEIGVRDLGTTECL